MTQDGPAPAPQGSNEAIESDMSCDLLIIGTGISGLAVAASLPKTLAEKTLVVDRHGSWLKSWCNFHRVRGTKHLRWFSNMCLHPRDPEALAKFAQGTGRTAELREDPSHLPCPTVELLRDFTASELQQGWPACLREPIQGDAIDIDADEGGMSHGCEVTVRLPDGALRTIACKHVVYTGACDKPSVPKALADLTSSHPSRVRVIASPGAAPLDCASVEGRAVAVVGNGMTAMQLADMAAAAGATRVALLSRRPLAVQPLDAEAGWLGAKHRAAWDAADDRARLRMLREGRPGGSVDAQALQRVAAWAGAAAAVGRWDAVTVVENAEVAEAVVEDDPDGAVVLRVKRSAVGNARMRDLGSGSPEEAPQEIRCDVVVVACGTHVDVASEAPLRGLLEDCPTHVWGGFPVLDRRTLRWPGSPVFLLGRSASLVEGCLSENPIVVLRAARTVVGAITGSRGEHAGRAGGCLQVAPDGSANGDCAAPAAVPEPAETLPLTDVFAPPRRAPASCVDVSDLAPELPRKTIESYTTIDDDFKFTVRVEVGEAPSEARVLIQERSLEAWIVTSKSAYRLHVPRLYRNVVPQRCKWRLDEKKARLVIRLFKKHNIEWKSLKG